MLLWTSLYEQCTPVALHHKWGVYTPICHRRGYNAEAPSLGLSKSIQGDVWSPQPSRKRTTLVEREMTEWMMMPNRQQSPPQTCFQVSGDIFIRCCKLLLCVFFLSRCDGCARSHMCRHVPMMSHISQPPRPRLPGSSPDDWRPRSRGTLTAHPHAFHTTCCIS